MIYEVGRTAQAPGIDNVLETLLLGKVKLKLVFWAAFLSFCCRDNLAQETASKSQRGICNRLTVTNIPQGHHSVHSYSYQTGGRPF